MGAPRVSGRWSIKVVLPVAAPELRYEALEICDGEMASERWMQCVIDADTALSAEEREQIFASLRVYCRLDTLAMVRVWEHAWEVTGARAPA